MGFAMAAQSQPVQTGTQLQRRLGEQFHALSQVSEAMIFRLLELEERLGALEEQLAGLNDRDDQVTPGLGMETGEILALTEARLARLEDLLVGRRPLLGGSSGSGHGSNSGESAGTYAGINGGIRAGETPAFREAAFDPFPEEEEQSFMDDLIA